MFFVCILHVLNLFVSCVRLPPLFPNLGQAEVVAGKPRPSTGEPLLGRKSRERAEYPVRSIPRGVSRAHAKLREGWGRTILSSSLVCDQGRGQKPEILRHSAALSRKSRVGV